MQRTARWGPSIYVYGMKSPAKRGVVQKAFAAELGSGPVRSAKALLSKIAQQLPKVFEGYGFAAKAEGFEGGDIGRVWWRGRVLTAKGSEVFRLSIISELRSEDYGQRLGMGDPTYVLELRAGYSVYPHAEVSKQGMPTMRDATKLLADVGVARMLDSFGGPLKGVSVATDIPTVKAFIGRLRTWFELEDETKTDLRYDTRENGDVGDEEPGRADIQEARRLQKALLAEYGAEAIRIEIELVDEWVSLEVSLKAGKRAAEVGTDVSEIYAISPEMLHRLVGDGEWFTLADSMWGQNPDGSYEEVWAQMQEVIREHGGAVFQTGGDGTWDVRVEGAPDGQGYTDPYGTPEFDKAARVASRYLQAKRVAFLHGLRTLVAGWWQIHPGSGGGIWFSSKERLIPETDKRYNGDGPADRMGDFLDELNQVYVESWGRPAYPEELRAVFDFVMGPKERPVEPSPDRIAARYLDASAHKKSVALMKFLSQVAKGLGPQVANNVYVVGGAVRDFVLDRPIKDVDVVVDSVGMGGKKDAAWFAKQVQRAIPTNVNLTTNNYMVEILTIAGSWELDGLDMNGEVIEIANTRSEAYSEGGWKPDSVEPADIKTDITRRELTYNCMAGDTLIPTERGLLRIDEIAQRSEGDVQDIELRVSGQAGTSVAVGWQYSGHTRTVRVASEWGHEFSCTGHHPVLVLQDNEHVWVAAEDLQPGDLLCVGTRSLTREAVLPLDLSEPERPIRGWLKEVRKPARMTPDLAFLIGCIVAEGSNTHNRVSFSNGDPALLSRYAETFESVFGFLPSRNRVAKAGDERVFHGVPYTVSRDCFDLYADSKTVVGWLEELGLYMSGRQGRKSASHFKVVPWSILQADRESQAAFLAAYLEGDGSIETKSGRITYISVSPQLRRQLQALLGSHGVLSQVKRRFVMLTAVDSAKLWSEIQSFMVSKIHNYDNRKFKSRNRFGIPKEYLAGFLSGRRLRSCGREGVVYRTDDGGEVVLQGMGESIRTLKRLLHDAHARGDFDAFLDGLGQISSVEAAKLRHLFDCSYQYVPVSSLEGDVEQDVFDISMHEGVEPAFVANGVVVHNTLLLRLIDLANGPDKKDIIDLTGCGLKDLEEGRMQCPASPDTVFSDDPSRMIRVIKFALRYGHKLTPDTKAAILRNAKKLKNVPASHLSQMLVDIVLTDSNWKKALAMMEDLNLLEPVKDLLQSNKSFRAALQNHVNKSNMDMLFGLMDVGLPLGAKVQFLSPADQTRVRKITLGMDRDDAWAFLGLLKSPNSAFSDNGFYPALEVEYGVAKNQQGTFNQVVKGVTQKLLLEDPSLADNASRFRQLTSQGVATAMRSARLATQKQGSMSRVGIVKKHPDGHYCLYDSKGERPLNCWDKQYTSPPPDDVVAKAEATVQFWKHQSSKTAAETGDGKSVGLFIPLPERLAELFPDLGDQDSSPAHVTLLYVGNVTKDREALFLEVVSGILEDEASPIRAWTNGIDFFAHPDKDRRVYYVPIRFSRDMGTVRDRLAGALVDAGFEVQNSFPLAFNAHTTLEYVDGFDSEYEGFVPDGAWEFSSVEVWGLPRKHTLPLGTYDADTLQSILAAWR